MEGDYEIYARWPADASHTTSALYTLTHVNGDFTANINQQQNGGMWLSGGVFTLDSDSKITLTGAAAGYLVADGVKVVWADTPENETRLSNAGSELYFVHNDHLGTPRFITNSSEAVVWSQVQTAFGEAVENKDPDGDGSHFRFNVRFPGQYFDEETGLHYNYFRDYDPETGRYVQSDPIGLKGGLNTYIYVDSNPLIFSDPLGLCKRAGRDEYGNQIWDCNQEGDHGYAHNRGTGDASVFPPQTNHACMEKCKEEKTFECMSMSLPAKGDPRSLAIAGAQASVCYLVVIAVCSASADKCEEDKDCEK